jgi:N-acetylglucosaminyldiphosphoundecaprenol N-acetyl-beta-D-mannosaminyltransferase
MSMGGHSPFPAIKIFGLHVAALDIKQTTRWIENEMLAGRPVMHADINTFKVVQMKDDVALFQSVAAADFISADGMGIVWAARLLGKKLPDRVTGIDLMLALVESAAKTGKTIYLIGAKPEIVAAVVAVFNNTYGDSLVKGFRDGYFRMEDSASIAQEIQQAGADMVFVGMNSPRKEHFLFQNRHILKDIPFCMGVGGSFDVISGSIPRAPKWIQKIGMEWIFRLLQEPKRLLKRYTIDNLRFFGILIQEWIHPQKKT